MLLIITVILLQKCKAIQNNWKICVMCESLTSDPSPSGLQRAKQQSCVFLSFFNNYLAWRWKEILCYNWTQGFVAVNSLCFYSVSVSAAGNRSLLHEHFRDGALVRIERIFGYIQQCFIYLDTVEGVLLPIFSLMVYQYGFLVTDS